MRELQDFDLVALHDALDEKRVRCGLTWRGAADEINRPFRGSAASGISPSTISGVSKKHAVEGDAVLQMLIWLERTPESFMPEHDRHPVADEALPVVGPNRILRWDAPALHRAVAATRVDLGMTWDQVAQQTGCSVTSLTGLSRAQRVGFPHVMRIVRWLGRPAAEFTRASPR